MVDQTPLTNADFRKLLATPRPGRGADATPSHDRGGETPRQGGAAKKTSKPGPHYLAKLKEKKQAEEDEEHKYRDRAEERRRGINPDYQAANQLLNVISSSDVDPNKLSIEESKYLGGDLEHTHLVKGLDYALLQKVSKRGHACYLRCGLCSLCTCTHHVCVSSRMATCATVLARPHAYRRAATWRSSSRSRRQGRAMQQQLRQMASRQRQSDQSDLSGRTCPSATQWQRACSTRCLCHQRETWCHGW